MKQYQQANRLQLIYLLNSSQVLIAFLKIKHFIKNQKFADFKTGFEYIHQFISRAKQKGMILKHVKILSQIFNDLLDYLQVFEIHSDQKLNQVFKILDKVSQFIGSINEILERNSRFCKTISSNISISGPLAKAHNQLLFLQGKCLIL